MEGVAHLELPFEGITKLKKGTRQASRWTVKKQPYKNLNYVSNTFI